MSKDDILTQGARIAALRNAIREAFPAFVYQGNITRHDGAWLPELTEENAILDDDMFLHEALRGRKWTEVSKTFLMHAPDAFVLLSAGALSAYLGAWLDCSLEKIDEENLVRSFFIYSFSTRDASPNSGFMIALLSGLSREQQLVVRLLMKEFSRSEPSKLLREHAESALTLVEQVIGNNSDT